MRCTRCHSPKEQTGTYPAQPILHKAPVAELLVVEAAVVAVPLQAVMVVQDVEVTVVEEPTDTTCVQEGNAEAEHEDDEDDEPEELAVLLWLFEL